VFYSERLNLLFIASPKTGCTSVESYLLNLDPDGERFKITLEDRVIDSSCVKSDSLGHATARELREALGAKHYDAMHTFGFVRHPIEKLVSAYFFTRKGSLLGAFQIRTAKSKWRLVAKRIIGITAARILPFWFWALLFPMKKCSDYFLDSSGNIIVDFLGATDRLDADLTGILSGLGVAIRDLRVPHVNQSSHKKAHEYLVQDGFLHRCLQKRYADDLRLFALAKHGYVDCDKLRMS